MPSSYLYIKKVIFKLYAIVRVRVEFNYKGKRTTTKATRITTKNEEKKNDENGTVWFEK